jgi:hypothetical protein
VQRPACSPWAGRRRSPPSQSHPPGSWEWAFKNTKFYKTNTKQKRFHKEPLKAYRMHMEWSSSSYSLQWSKGNTFCRTSWLFVLAAKRYSTASCRIRVPGNETTEWRHENNTIIIKIQKLQRPQHKINIAQCTFRELGLKLAVLEVDRFVEGDGWGDRGFELEWG